MRVMGIAHQCNLVIIFIHMSNAAPVIQHRKYMLITQNIIIKVSNSALIL